MQGKERLGQFLNQLNMVVDSDGLDEIWGTLDDDGKGKVFFTESVSWATDCDIDLPVGLETADPKAQRCMECGITDCDCTSYCSTDDYDRFCKEYGCQGLPHIIQKKSQAAEFAGKVLENSVVTKQTGAAARPCNASMPAERLQINADLATSLDAEKADLAEAEKTVSRLGDSWWIDTTEPTQVDCITCCSPSCVHRRRPKTLTAWKWP